MRTKFLHQIFRCVLLVVVVVKYIFVRFFEAQDMDRANGHHSPDSSPSLMFHFFWQFVHVLGELRLKIKLSLFDPWPLIADS